MADEGPTAGRRLLLDDQLCFALYAATNAITRRYRSPLAELGLTYPQYLVLVVLWQHGPSAVGELARRLELASHAVSPLVDRLELAGLVTRQRGHDRRTVVVAPTPRGLDLHAAASRAQAEVACATGLDEVGLARLRESLRALAAQLGTRLDPPRTTGRAPAAGTPAHEGETS